jgi:hypothetical protein
VGLRPAAYETKGKSARCLVTVGAASTAKASSEGWRLRLRPNSQESSFNEDDGTMTFIMLTLPLMMLLL